jgi:hypothetical protein
VERCNLAVERCNLQWIDVIGSGKMLMAVERCIWQRKDVIGSDKVGSGKKAVERRIWQWMMHFAVERGLSLCRYGIQTLDTFCKTCVTFAGGTLFLRRKKNASKVGAWNERATF